MALVRTTITIPADTLELIDAVAGKRGRSAYIADVVLRQVRRDNARMVFAKYAGALKDSTSWGRTDEEVLETLREIRASWDRPWIWEDPDALSAGHDAADRPRAGSRRRAARHGVTVRKPE